MIEKTIEEKVEVEEVKKPAPKKRVSKKKVEAELVQPAAKKKSKGKRYIAVFRGLYHPFIGKMIHTGSPGVEIEKVDSWLEAQIKRGLIKEVKG